MLGSRALLGGSGWHRPDRPDANRWSARRGPRPHNASSLRRPGRAGGPRTVASQAATGPAPSGPAPIADRATGVAFPWSARFWDSELLQCLGVGHRVKKIAIVGVKVYAIAVFADTAKASAELAKGVKAGTVKKADDASVCDVLVKGAFNRVVQLQLVRDVDGPTFIDAIRKAIEKRMTEAKQLDKLQQFEAFFLNRKLKTGCNVVLRVRADNTLDVAVADKQVAWDKVKPDLKIASLDMCQALLGVFLGKDSVVPTARAATAAELRKLAL